MDENIIVRIQGESDLSQANSQIKDLEARYQAAQKRLAELRQEELQNEAAIRQQVKSQQLLDKALADNAKKYQKLKQEQQAVATSTKQSIDQLKQSVSAYNLLNNAGGSLRTRLKEIREELMQMEMAGDTSSAAFVELSVQAAKLQDQMGDTQKQIQVLSSDTVHLDAAMSAGQGLVGTFNIATSAAALLGDESEELQQAFLKVQAALAILNGVQQVANTLNKDSAARVVLRTAYNKLFVKSKVQETAATAANTAATTAEAGAQAANTVATGAATKAQWSLNAAMAANPIGAIITLVVAAVAAIAALTVGVVKLVGAFSAAGKAQRAYKNDLKELEKETVNASIQNGAIAQNIVNNSKRIDDAYRQEVNAAKARNASDTELLEIEKRHADERAKLYTEKIPTALKNQEKVVKDAKKVYQDALDVLNNTSGAKKREKAMKQLEEAEKRYLQEQNNYIALQKERDDALQQQTEAEQALADKRLAIEAQLNQSEINLMKSGQKKEIAQIRETYKERMKEISGNSAEEAALRASLLAEQEKEIAAVRRKYRLAEKEAAVQETRNSLAQDQTNVELKKKLAEEEAAYKIAALDRETLSAKQYAAQKKAIEIQLAEDLKKIADERAAKEAEIQKTITNTALLAAQQRAGVEYSADVYAIRKQQLEQIAQAEIDAVNRSIATEEEKAARIEAINQKLSNDLVALKKEQVSQEITATYEALNNELQARANHAEEVLANKKSSLQEILAAEKEAKEARDGLLDSEEQELNERYANQEISYNEYQKRLEEINHERIMNEIADEEAKFERINEITQNILSFVGDMASEIFGAISDMINQQLQDLDEYYTTDAEEAKEDANKKYISEKELENKKLALKKKAAAVEKASTLLSIGLNTAAAIMQAIAQFGPPPSPMGIAGIAMASALGITQMAIAAAKPLPQYAKGRKPGEGEYALVGEKGPEIMYIPDTASIIPNHLMNVPERWAEFGVPQPKIPAMPDVDKAIMQAAIMAQLGMAAFDYGRLGKEIASRIPAQKHVTFTIDRYGVTRTEGAEQHTYLNRKYAGAWN